MRLLGPPDENNVVNGYPVDMVYRKLNLIIQARGPFHFRFVYDPKTKKLTRGPEKLKERTRDFFVDKGNYRTINIDYTESHLLDAIRMELEKHQIERAVSIRHHSP